MSKEHLDGELHCLIERLRHMKMTALIPDIGLAFDAMDRIEKILAEQDRRIKELEDRDDDWWKDRVE